MSVFSQFGNGSSIPVGGVFEASDECKLTTIVEGSSEYLREGSVVPYNASYAVAVARGLGLDQGLNIPDVNYRVTYNGVSEDWFRSESGIESSYYRYESDQLILKATVPPYEGYAAASGAMIIGSEYFAVYNTLDRVDTTNSVTRTIVGKSKTGFDWEFKEVYRFNTPNASNAARTLYPKWESLAGHLYFPVVLSFPPNDDSYGLGVMLVDSELNIVLSANTATGYSGGSVAGGQWSLTRYNGGWFVIVYSANASLYGQVQIKEKTPQTVTILTQTGTYADIQRVSAYSDNIAVLRSQNQESNCNTACSTYNSSTDVNTNIAAQYVYFMLPGYAQQLDMKYDVTSSTWYFMLVTTTNAAASAFSYSKDDLLNRIAIPNSGSATTNNVSYSYYEHINGNSKIPCTNGRLVNKDGTISYVPNVPTFSHCLVGNTSESIFNKIVYISGKYYTAFFCSTYSGTDTIRYLVSIFSSTDNRNWTCASQTTVTGLSLVTNMTAVNGNLIIFTDSNKILHSTDGVTVNQVTIAGLGVIYDVTYFNSNYFAAAAFSTSNCSYSSTLDGLAAGTAITVGTTGNSLVNFAISGSKIIAVNGSGAIRASYSLTGLTGSWTASGGLTAASVLTSKALYDGTNFFITYSGNIYKSTDDGVSFTGITFQDTGVTNSFVFNNGTYYIGTATKVLQSIDAINWRESSMIGVYTSGISNARYGAPLKPVVLNNRVYVLSIYKSMKAYCIPILDTTLVSYILAKSYSENPNTVMYTRIK